MKRPSKKIPRRKSDSPTTGADPAPVQDVRAARARLWARAGRTGEGLVKLVYGDAKTTPKRRRKSA